METKSSKERVENEEPALEEEKGADSAGGAPAASSAPVRCQNCEARLTGPFCAQCGQEAQDRAVPLTQLGRQAMGEIFSFDTRFLRTLKPLLFKPGFLTNEYFAGRRKRYVPPPRMYVFVGFVFFLCFALLAGSDFQEGFQRGFDRERDDEVVATDSLDQEARDFTGDDQQGTSSRGQPRSAEPGYAEHEMRAAGEDFGKIFVQQLSVIFFAAVPLLAAVLKVLYVRSGRFYVHHIIFALHVQSFFFIMLLAVTLVSEGIDWLPESINGSAEDLLLWWFLASVGTYLLVAMRRAYKQKWWKTVLKTLFAAVSYALIFSIVAFVVVSAGAALFY